MSSFATRLKKKIKRSLQQSSKNETVTKEAPDARKILLLTNRDSDNVGDQVIEASDISLIKAAMKNLGQPENSFKVVSKAASIIPKDYVKSKDESRLEGARRNISQSDLVFFGGAPMFNYRYQIFYERTARTIELAKEYNTPVLFSAIGVEGYDEDNAKCQRLKETLNFDCVKRITTRDDFESLQKYKENPNLFIDKVADPAVFCKWIFRDFITQKQDRPKKVGLFIIRANAFVDNGIDFPWQESAQMWVDVANELEKAGYDYEFITSGHFGDEAFVDRLIREYRVPGGKCVFNINTPEDLFGHMSEYDAVISCRLHPSIIAFSMEIPSIGIIWNSKVTGFYESIGQVDRTLRPDQIKPAEIPQMIDRIIEEGVHQDEDFLMSVYKNIYSGLRDSFGFDKRDDEVYSFEELLANLPKYKKTSKKEAEKKLRRKFRRTYDTYNQQFTQYEKVKAELKELKKRLDEEK